MVDLVVSVLAGARVLSVNGDIVSIHGSFVVGVGLFGRHLCTKRLIVEKSWQEEEKDGKWGLSVDGGKRWLNDGLDGHCSGFWLLSYVENVLERPMTDGKCLVE